MHVGRGLSSTRGRGQRPSREERQMSGGGMNVNDGVSGVELRWGVYLSGLVVCSSKLSLHPSSREGDCGGVRHSPPFSDLPHALCWVCLCWAYGPAGSPQRHTWVGLTSIHAILRGRG